MFVMCYVSSDTHNTEINVSLYDDTGVCFILLQQINTATPLRSISVLQALFFCFCVNGRHGEGSSSLISLWTPGQWSAPKLQVSAGKAL